MKPHLRMILVGVVAPLVVAAAGVVAVIALLPKLPNPVATHWGASGTPNNFGSPIAVTLLIVITIVAYCGLALLVVISGRRHLQAHGEEAVTVNQRIILAIGPFLSVLLTVVTVGSLVIQIGLEDARNAPSVLPTVITAFALGIAAGVLAWVVLPAATPPQPAGDPGELPTMELSTTTRAVWLRHAEPSVAVGSSVVGILAFALLIGAVSLWSAASTTAVAVYVVFMLLVGGLSISSLFWRVTADATGFRARSVLGVPRFFIPLNDIAAAIEIEVNPLRDFGGWGIRLGGNSRVGVITKGGEAIEITRKDGRVLVVTVSNARSCAALLNAMVARA